MPDKPTFTFGTQLRPEGFASRCTAPACSLTTSLSTPRRSRITRPGLSLANVTRVPLCTYPAPPPLRMISERRHRHPGLVVPELTEQHLLSARATCVHIPPPRIVAQHGLPIGLRRGTAQGSNPYSDRHQRDQTLRRLESRPENPDQMRLRAGIELQLLTSRNKLLRSEKPS